MYLSDISESLTAAAPYRVQRGLGGSYLNSFAINGTTYFVAIKRADRKHDWWSLSMSTRKADVSGRMDGADIAPTGQGNAFQVFATVKKIITDFLSENHPDYFQFGTKNDKLAGVYQKMFKRFSAEAEQLGYHPTENFINGYDAWAYVADSYVSVSNDKRQKVSPK